MKSANNCSTASETYAFAYLRARGFVTSMVIDEETLARVHHGQKIPEGIFLTDDGVPVSVEVKRIPSLRRGDGTRAWHGGFAWQNTIVAAMEKAHDTIVCAHQVRAHHVVLCTPDDERVRSRIERHAHRILHTRAASGLSSCAARRLVLHVVSAPARVMNLQ